MYIRHNHGEKKCENRLFKQLIITDYIESINEFKSAPSV